MNLSEITTHPHNSPLDGSDTLTTFTYSEYQILTAFRSLHSSWTEMSASPVNLERSCCLLCVRFGNPHEWSLWENKEEGFVLASLICFWATKLLQNRAVRFKFPMKVFPRIVFQVSGPNFISSDGLGFVAITTTKKTPNLSALNNKGLFLLMLHIQHVLMVVLAPWQPPSPGLRLTGALLFGMSPDSQQNEENLETCKMALKYFCPKVTNIASAHLSQPYLISRVGECAPPMCPEERGTRC